MELATTFANNFLILLDAMAIYILIGLLIAGILKQLVPNDFVIKHLGRLWHLGHRRVALSFSHRLLSLMFDSES